MKFIIEKKWFERYIEYLRSQTSVPPGPVNNEELVLEGNKLNLNLKPGEDYLFVTSEIWQFISQLYGASPSIVEIEEERKYQEEEEIPEKMRS